MRLGFIATLLIVLAIHLPPLLSQSIIDEIMNGQKSITIPFTYDQNFILIDVTIDQKFKARFIVDTGSEHTIILNREITGLLGLALGQRIPIYGADHTRRMWAYIARGVPLQPANTPERLMDVIVLDENTTLLSNSIGQHIDGILGGSYFKNTVLEIDYKAKRLVIHDANQFSSPLTDGYHALPLNIVRSKPFALLPCSMRENQQVELTFLLDSGSTLPIIVYDDRGDVFIPDNTSSGGIGQGLGGQLIGRSAKINFIDIAGYTLNDPIVYFQERNPLADSLLLLDRDGIIGSDLLDGFHVYIDYVRSIAYLKGRKNWEESIKYDRSGLTVLAYGHLLNQYIVQEIMPGSPAEEAGMKRGDIVKRVGIWPSSWLSLSAINARLKRSAGKTVRLTIQREGKKLKKKIVLRDLL